MKKLPLLLLAIIFFTACSKDKSKQKALEINPEFANYISAYTSGLVSKVSPLQIVLQADFPVEMTEEGVISEDILKFTPKITGTTYLEKNNTIKFVPSKTLTPGQVYTGHLDLSKIIQAIPDSLSTFPFQFQVKKQDYHSELLGLESTTTSPMNYNLKGELFTNDVAQSAEVEKMLEVKLNGNSVPVQWQHADNQQEHKFTIPNLRSDDEQAELTLNWKGETIQAERDEEQKFTLPAKNSFEVVQVRSVSYPEQYVVINFSQPIDEDQFMQGLVEINKSDENTTEEVTYNNETNANYVKNIIIDGNDIKIYTSKKIGGTFDLKIFPGIKSALNHTIEKEEIHSLNFNQLYPEVKFVGTGNIIPQAEGVYLPFEAVGLNAVRVSITKIYEKNIHAFFQHNQYNTNENLRMVGKKVFSKVISLKNQPGFNIEESKIYQLELSKFIQPEKGAIYNVEFSFDKNFAAFPCDPNSTETKGFLTPMEIPEDNYLVDTQFQEGAYYYNDYYYPENYDWQERNNPCHISYYTANRNVTRNVLSTDLGLIAKVGKDRKAHITVTNLISTDPENKVEITAYDLQNQVVGSGTTDKKGFAEFPLSRKPFLFKAERGENKSYVRVDDGSSLSLSNFAVDGLGLENGMSGFIYGERGVWRPGDSIHLTFVLNQPLVNIPTGQPAVLELKNPEGQIMSRSVNNSPVNGFYTFGLQTYPDARTGNWNAEITLGGMKFYKTLKIETIKPNRLKITTQFPSEILNKETSNSYELQATWLSGANAKNLATKVVATLTAIPTYFESFPNYSFDDPSREFMAEEQTIFDGSLNEHGKTNITTKISTELLPPGRLNLGLFTKVFEPGGEFSTKYEAKSYSPYMSYVGLNLPVEQDDYMRRLETNKNYKIPVASVDLNGKPISSKLEVKVYRLKNTWWYNANDADLAYYVSREYETLAHEQNITTQQGRGSFDLRIPNDAWGNYFIRVCDSESGHCSGEKIWIDGPDWRSRGNIPTESASILNFKSDKEKYQIGEEAVITIPSSIKGKVLVSIENSKGVLSKKWENAEDATTTLKIPITAEMSPNAYVNISILQPHAQTTNDLPIRMYGVIPIFVENPDRKLHPVVVTPDEIRPKSDYKIEVKEKNGSAMTYTLAVVDEGLLDITNFKTPDVFDHFNKKQSLGVKTWDIFNYVLGAYGGRIESVFTIGGDMAMQSQNKEKINRFEPVVKFLGPFTLAKGETRAHQLKMDNYVGRVKVMVVAGNGEAFGSAEKTIHVRQPLMTLTTLPRILNPGDIVQMPVTVFAMDKKINKVDVKVESNQFLQAQDETTKTINFTETGEKLVNFAFKVPKSIGKAKIKVQVSGHGERADQELELEVRSPNAPITRSSGAVVTTADPFQASFAPFGMEGTNLIELQLSTLPEMRLGERLNFLLSYPHGCVEQITSSAFPQLYLNNLMELTDYQKSEIEKNIKEALNKIKTHQLSGGGLAYWQGAGEADDWGSSYALHFVLKAEQMGYEIPIGLKSGLITFQQREAKHWNYYSDNLNYADQQQVYRLYTLALAGSPDLALMNRIKEKPLNPTTKWQLISAYTLAGQGENALKMVGNTPTQVMDYHYNSYTYGSSLRDQAIILTALNDTGQRQKGAELLRRMADELQKDTWLSTQTTAFSLMAISEFVKGEKAGKGLNASLEINGQSRMIRTQKPVFTMELPNNAGELKVKNPNSGYLYASIVNTGTPMDIITKKEERNLQITVDYYDLAGNKITIDNLPQGTDFKAVVNLENPGLLGDYYELALTQIFPSGWEIINTRVNDQVTSYTNAGLEYQDFRDDRVYSYFDLKSNNSISITTLLNATYAGEFDLPATWVQAMYNNDIYALEPGRRVKVVNHGK